MNLSRGYCVYISIYYQSEIDGLYEIPALPTYVHKCRINAKKAIKLATYCGINFVPHLICYIHPEGEKKKITTKMSSESHSYEINTKIWDRKLQVQEIKEET